MDRYVGVDAHAETCTLGVVGPSGRRLTSKVVETNGRLAAIVLSMWKREEVYDPERHKGVSVTA